MHDDDEPEDEPPTSPSTPAAARRSTVPPREGWAFERAAPSAAAPGAEAPIAAVSILCQSCLRPFRIAPPRFTVAEDGDVVARDEGAGFRCTTCDAPIGPLRLADWRFGRLG